MTFWYAVVAISALLFFSSLFIKDNDTSFFFRGIGLVIGIISAIVILILMLYKTEEKSDCYRTGAKLGVEVRFDQHTTSSFSCVTPVEDSEIWQDVYVVYELND